MMPVCCDRFHNVPVIIPLTQKQKLQVSTVSSMIETWGLKDAVVVVWWGVEISPL